MELVKKCRKAPTMSLNNKLKYDDFGELVWVQPQKPKRNLAKKFTYNNAFKLLGEALI
jgi:hypothetical protein